VPACLAAESSGSGQSRVGVICTCTARFLIVSKEHHLATILDDKIIARIANQVNTTFLSFLLLLWTPLFPLSFGASEVFEKTVSVDPPSVALLHRGYVPLANQPTDVLGVVSAQFASFLGCNVFRHSSL
jgi:hypothetical protein